MLDPAPARSRLRAAEAAPRSCAARPASLRLAVALLALYALALQSVLGGMAFAAAAGPEHVLCLTGDGPQESAPAGKSLPAQGHMACCTAAHIPAPAALPAPAPVALPVQPRRTGATPQRPEIAAAPRAPPGISPGARAPPVA